MKTSSNSRLFGLLLALAAAACNASSFEAGTLKWAFGTDDDVVASPTVGDDGTIYVGSTDGYLYAVNPNGTEKWSFETGSDIWGSVVIGPDGTLYFGSGDGYIYRLNPDGTEIWRFAMEDGTFSTPALGADGTIYVGSLDKNLYAINPNGTRKWAFPTGGTISSSPAVGADGSVYVGSADNLFYALDPDGSLQWSFNAGDWIDSPTLAADGTIYVGAVNQTLYAFRPNGAIAWTFRARGAVWGSVALGADGTLYFGSAGNRIYALNPDGSVKWEFVTENWVNATPLVGPDGTIYIGSGDQRLYAIDPQGNQKWAFTASDPLFSSPAIGPDGTIYVGTWTGWDHNLYAVHGGGPSAGTLWTSTDAERPFAVEQVGDSLFGQGTLTDFTGVEKRLSLAGELVDGVLTAPLVAYVGRATSGAQADAILVGNRILGDAEVRVDTPAQVTLAYRLGARAEIYAGMGDEDAIDFVYRQLFGRNADPGGMAYYVGRLQSGASTRETLMGDILAGAVGNDAEASQDLVLEDSLTLIPAP